MPDIITTAWIISSYTHLVSSGQILKKPCTTLDSDIAGGSLTTAWKNR